jgi:hypothetical protein
MVIIKQNFYIPFFHFKSLKSSWAWGSHNASKENCEFEALLGYVRRPCFKRRKSLKFQCILHTQHQFLLAHYAMPTCNLRSRCWSTQDGLKGLLGALLAFSL